MKVEVQQVCGVGKGVSIDGVDQGEVDLYSPRVEWWSRIRFCCQAAGKHVARVRVTGTKAAAPSDAVVDVDAFVVELMLITPAASQSQSSLHGTPLVPSLSED